MVIKGQFSIQGNVWNRLMGCKRENIASLKANIAN